MGEKEPEQLIGDALYLLQLCQQDLNIYRRDTVWARARAARLACEELERLALEWAEKSHPVRVGVGRPHG